MTGRPGYDEAVQAAVAACDPAHGDPVAAIDAAYPIIEAAVRAEIVEALREFGNGWDHDMLAADFIERHSSPLRAFHGPRLRYEKLSNGDGLMDSTRSNNGDDFWYIRFRSALDDAVEEGSFPRGFRLVGARITSDGLSGGKLVYDETLDGVHVVGNVFSTVNPEVAVELIAEAARDAEAFLHDD